MLRLCYAAATLVAGLPLIAAAIDASAPSSTLAVTTGAAIEARA